LVIIPYLTEFKSRSHAAVSRTRLVSREPGTAAGRLVLLTSGKPTNQLKYQVVAIGNAAGCILA